MSRGQLPRQGFGNAMRPQFQHHLAFHQRHRITEGDPEVVFQANEHLRGQRGIGEPVMPDQARGLSLDERAWRVRSRSF